MGVSSNEAVEDYLKLIYELSLDKVPVRTSQLAEGLGLSLSSVSEMLKRLNSKKLIRYRPYHGVSLTAKGRQRALAVLRRHRLWEVFLHRKLGLPWSRLHHHACQLEHGTDDELADALADHLSNPRLDPHGDPIPDRTGRVVEPERLRLHELDDGQEAEIQQCTNEDPRLLSYLDSLGLEPGVRVRLQSHAPFNGPLHLSVDGRDCAVGIEVARTLIVSI